MVWWGDAFPAPMTERLVEPRKSVTLFPSSLTRNDGMARRVRSSLRSRNVSAHLVVPQSPVASFMGTALTNGTWRPIQIDGRALRVDRRLFQGESVGLVSVTEEHRRGPFALDLASHFLHPLDRARLLISRDRSRLVAGIAAQAPLDHWVIGTPVGAETLWLATDDVIAAELWALALAERFLGSTLEMQGPWEDPTVQRATELDLGVRIPSDMHVLVDGAASLSKEVTQLITQCRRRLGMPAPGGVS